jgi:glycosyltransferase involved in cell wall biosynthesis
MKILIYAESFYPSVGGVQNSSRLIADYLYQNNTEVIVLTHTADSGDMDFPYVIMRNPSSKECRKAIAGVDLVYLNGLDLGILMYAKFRGKRVVMSYRDLTMICPKGTKWLETGPCLHKASLGKCIPCLRSSEAKDMVMRRLLRPYIKAFLSLFIDVNVCTNLFGFERFYLHRKLLIFNGIDTGLFVPAKKKENNKIPVILFVGRLIPEKGCQILLKAIRNLKQEGTPFHVLICGDGPYKNKLIEMSREYGLEKEVCFLGVRTGQDLVNAIQQSDVLVVPSLIDEPFGLSAAESMGCEVPVIASNVGGLGIMVKEVGLVFERGDEAGLAGQLKRLFEDPEMRMALGRKGRSIAVSRYDSEIMAGNYFRLFNELCNKKTRRVHNSA